MLEVHIVFVITFIIIIMLFLALHSNKDYFGSGPAIFVPEGGGMRGSYTDNINLAPVYTLKG